MKFEAGEQLWLAGERAPFAVFPLRGVISLEVSPGAGKQVEVAVVGREGFAGAALAPNVDGATMSGVAISAGEAFLMPRDIFEKYIAIPAFRAAVEAYTRFLLATFARIVGCSRVHVIEAACVGRLLLIQDRTQSDTLQLTQSVFARQLGVRRASINRALGGLQKRGVIEYDRRGHMTIRDRQELERIACPCYRTIRSEFEALVDGHGGF